MPDWLSESFQGDAALPLPVLVFRLTMGLVLGCVVAGSYRLTHGKMTSRSLSLMATLVLLTILIGIVTLVIGNSVARAFSLVGALSIVRFRTVVEDTRDTAFVIFAVAVGMAVGAGSLQVPLIGIPLTTLAAWLFRARDQAHEQTGSLCRTLSLRVGFRKDVEQILEPSLKNHLLRWNLSATSTTRQGAALNLIYHVCLLTEAAAIPLVSELNTLEGIQEIDLRQT